MTRFYASYSNRTPCYSKTTTLLATCTSTFITYKLFNKIKLSHFIFLYILYTGCQTRSLMLYIFMHLLKHSNKITLEYTLTVNLLFLLYIYFIVYSFFLFLLFFSFFFFFWGGESVIFVLDEFFPSSFCVLFNFYFLLLQMFTLFIPHEVVTH